MKTTLKQQRDDSYARVVETLDQISRLYNSGSTADTDALITALRSVSKAELSKLTILDEQLAKAS
jgi:hypothetical protein